MVIFLEYLIPKWILIQVFVIIFFLFYLLFKFRKTIRKEIKNHKIIYVLLIIIFLTGFTIRLISIVHWQYIQADNEIYIVTSALISDEGRFIFESDTPTFPSLVSLIINILDYNPSSGAIINLFFGSLSIILIYVFTNLLFKNRTISIISSILLCFSNLHFDASVNGGPFGVSIFFILVSLIILKITITKKKNFFIPLAFAVGLAAQTYYVEFILIIPIIIYLIINKINTKYIVIFTIAVLFSILPFSIEQYHATPNSIVAPDGFEETKSISITKLSCFWNKLNCNYFSGYMPRYNEYFNNTLLSGKELSGPRSYFLYLFMGKGRKYQDREYYLKDGKIRTNPLVVLWNNPEKNNRIYVLYFLFMLYGIYCFRKSLNDLILLLSVFFSFFLIYSRYSWLVFIYMSEIESVIIIPLVAYGIYNLIRKLKGKIRLVLSILIIILMVSPFFTETKIESYNDYSLFNKNNRKDMKEWWKENTYCKQSGKEIKDFCQKVYNSLDTRQSLKNK